MRAGKSAGGRPVSRRELAGLQKTSAIFLKLVDPDEHEGERFEVYEQELALMARPV